ncbi:MAG: hypothetical protein WCJ33_00445 [Pseudomonadota bacterium]
MKFLPIFLLFAITSCACALDDEDREKGKPSMLSCIAASLIKTKACETNRTDPNQCRY